MSIDICGTASISELDITEVQSLDDMNRNALGERAVVHAIARDKQRNKYGLIIRWFTT